MGVYFLRTGFRDREGVIDAQEVDDVYSAEITAAVRLIDCIPERTDIV